MKETKKALEEEAEAKAKAAAAKKGADGKEGEAGKGSKLASKFGGTGAGLKPSSLKTAGASEDGAAKPSGKV